MNDETLAETGVVQTQEWRQRRTTVAAVQRQLTAMLRTFREPTVGQAGHPPSRASVLNLVIRSTDAAELERALAALARLVSRHPSRTLALLVDAASPETALDAAITGHHHIRQHDEGGACFEVVRLVVHGAMTERLDSVVGPLLLEGLSTHVWWLGDAPPVNEPLLAVAERVIVDSTAFSDPLAGLVALAHRDGTAVGDLTWTRLAPWRELLAQFFDPTDARPFQRRIDRIDIDCVAGRLVGPLLLVGWLGHTLGWAVEQQWALPGEPLGVRMGDQPVLVQLWTARPAPVTPEDGLVGVTLYASSGPARFAAARAGDGECVATETELPGRSLLRRMAVAPVDAPVALLRRELDNPRADAQLQGALLLLEALSAPR